MEPRGWKVTLLPLHSSSDNCLRLADRLGLVRLPNRALTTSPKTEHRIPGRPLPLARKGWTWTHRQGLQGRSLPNYLSRSSPSRKVETETRPQGRWHRRRSIRGLAEKGDQRTSAGVELGRSSQKNTVTKSRANTLLTRSTGTSLIAAAPAASNDNRRPRS